MNLKDIETYQKNISLIIIILTTLTLSLGFIWYNRWPAALAAILSGTIWLYIDYRRWMQFGSFLFVLFVSLTAIGMWYGEASYVMFISLVLTLAAWDWSRFQVEIESTTNTENLTIIFKEKIRLLAIVVGSSLLLGILALSLQFSFNFNWTLILGLIVIIGLGSTIRTLRNSKQ